MLRFLLASVALSLVACSHASDESTATNDPNTTSGDETASASESNPQPDSTGPVVLAIPLPGIGRGSLRPPLQELWTRVEVAVAITPPDAPSVATEAAIAEWIAGPYTEWVRRRHAATQQAFAVTNGLTDLSDVERGFAVALVAYAYEDMAASVRGIAVPDSIASDGHLVGIFAEAIDRALLPIAEQAAVGYDGCLHLFDAAADPTWREWGPYCGQHLEDLREVFGRYARPAAEPAP